MNKLKNILDNKYKEKEKRLGKEEMKLREEFNSEMFCHLLVSIFLLPFLIMFPPFVIYYVILFFYTIHKFKKYRRKSKINILGEKKRED